MKDYLLALLELAVIKVEFFIKAIAADVPLETDWAQSSFGSWYNAPRQHALELMFLATFYILATFLSFRRLLRPGTDNYRLLTEFVPPYPASLTEKGMTLSLVCSLSLTLIHKIIRSRVWFMMQPCHASGLLLLLALVYPNKRSPYPHIIFNIYLHLQWGALAALAFPDLREHSMIGETFNFFAGKIPTVDRTHSSAGCTCIYDLQPPICCITPVLHLTSLVSGLNLNYMFAPPPSEFSLL